MVNKAANFHGFAIDNPHSIPTELMPKIARKFKTVPEMIWRVRCAVFDEKVSGRKITNGLVSDLAQYFAAAGYIREDLTVDAFVINRLYKAASYGTNLGIPICVQDLLNVYDCNADLYVRANRRYENYESPTDEQRKRIAGFIKKSLCDQSSKKRGMSDCYDVLNLRFGLEPGVRPHTYKEISAELFMSIGGASNKTKGALEAIRDSGLLAKLESEEIYAVVPLFVLEDSVVNTLCLTRTTQDTLARMEIKTIGRLIEALKCGYIDDNIRGEVVNRLARTGFDVE
ncbi:hypothetical protein J6X15_00665 [Candidatus Saccharibacteria bacterium]|nr:hypothetical protein [Candidatus Saccharibacteria bacterium]